MDKAIWLSIGHCLLDTLTYTLYNWEFWRGRSKPNRVTWGLWTYLAALNAGSYLVVSNDVVKTLLALENFLMCAFTFAFVLFRGETKPIDRWKQATAVLGVIAGLVWVLKRDAFWGSAVLQVGTIISFLPLFADLWEKPTDESPLPWSLWAVIYTSLLAVVLLRWDGDWHKLVYPVNYFLLHLAVFLMTLRGIGKKPILQ